ncbi:MAG: hypothetical protein ABJE66_13185 [Deltaproteobacteria bacterium]
MRVSLVVLAALPVIVPAKLGPISVLAQIQQDLGGSPVSYGPSFGFAVAGRLLDKYSAPYLTSPQLPYHD